MQHFETIIRSGIRLDSAGFSERFDREWDRLSQRFFKYEGLQHYAVDEGSGFHSFCAGDHRAALREFKTFFDAEQEAYAQVRARGVDLVRIHAARMPFSDYMRYEYYSYLFSQKLGERILYIDEAHAQPILGASVPGFLLFDDRCVIVQEYDPEGNFLGGWAIEDKTAIHTVSAIADMLLSASVPFDTYYKGDPTITSLAASML